MAAPAPRLLGPPEVRHQPAPAPTLDPAPATGDPFMDLLTAKFNSAVATPPMGLTENMSPTFLSSGDPCLDFFFQVVPDTPPETLTGLLGAAWEQNPLTALKLTCHLRGVRGTGKSDREGFYAAALWLHRHHPKTLALNALAFAEFGYLKDLLEILHRLLYGGDVRKVAKEERTQKKRRGRGRWRWPLRGRGGRGKRGKIALAKEQPREERIAAEQEKVKVRIEEASALRKKKRAEMATRAVERYHRDPEYRALHDRVSDLFAALLLADLEHLKSGHLRRISLGAKWCPSLDSSFDLSTLICESIGRRVFPLESHPEYREIEEEHYAYRVRDRLRKEVLVPLRRALELPEVYMSAQQWGVLPYNRVASVAMKTYKKLFLKHDPGRFGEFLSKVREGKAKIAAGALLPHEVLAEAARGEEDDVAELQWRRMVKDLSDKGKLRNCIAVCDVSGSMHGTPMEVCVALGLLVSELNEEPWRGKVITFSQEPQLHRIEGETIKDKMSFVEGMDWGMNTDFQKVFDQILRVAVEGRLPEDKMIRRVFVFSDMEFDQASANSWETDYEAICRKFREKGYGSAVPQIIFWNLRSSRSVPVVAGQKGVALVSGFSKNMLTMFLEGDGVVSPQKVMEAAISGKEYQKLVVFD
ncbi:hypothetical protein Taro_043106 [Colocasia esculenta]|uniref:Uncharacterized protein n=1 Tax=Colocasia esculenta TaxID=4460 RepID=A0A843WUR8_COLES|nr:hypothetical protein [Colocasia esculenta]